MRAHGELAWHGCARAAGAVGERGSVHRGAASACTRTRAHGPGLARRGARPRRGVRSGARVRRDGVARGAGEQGSGACGAGQARSVEEGWRGPSRAAEEEGRREEKKRKQKMGKRKRKRKKEKEERERKKGEGDGEIRAAIAAPDRPRAASGTRARSGATRGSRANRVVDSDVGVGSFEDREIRRENGLSSATKNFLNHFSAWFISVDFGMLHYPS